MSPDEQEAKSIIYGKQKVMLIKLSSGNIGVFDSSYHFHTIIPSTPLLDELCAIPQTVRVNVRTDPTPLIDTTNIDL